MAAGKPSKDSSDLVISLYLEQTAELSNVFKKNFTGFSGVIDFSQMVALMQSSVKFWNILLPIEKEFNQFSGAASGASKQPIFVIKFSETIKSMEDFIDKQLQAFESRIDSYTRSSLTPSVTEELLRNLGHLHGFYANANGIGQSMFFMSVDSLLYPLRPFANLAKRLKGESSHTPALQTSVRLYSKLLDIARSTRITKSAKSFIDKLTQFLKECCDLLLANAIGKVADLMAKEKESFRKDILRLALDPTNSNPVFVVLATIAALKDRELKASFLESLLQQAVALGKKMIPTQEEFLAQLREEARPSLAVFLGINLQENN
jgi:hypothetical protein